MKPLHKKLAMGAGIVIMIFLLILSYFEFRDMNRIFDVQTEPENRMESYQTGNMMLTKIEMDQNGESRIEQYITVLSITRPALYREQIHILQESDHTKPVSDLTGHPSFLVTDEHESFWKSQFYALHIFSMGGAWLFMIFAAAFAWIYFREGERYFNRRLKPIIHGLLLLVIAGIVLYTVIYGRMVYFLNNEFNMNESLLSGFTEVYDWTFILLAVMFLYAFIEKAVPLQEEQDLTV